MRTFAVINTHGDADILKNIIEKLPKDSEIVVFQTKKNEISSRENVKYVDIAEEIAESGSKIKNFVNAYFFAREYNGFLHVIEDAVQIYNDPSTFLDEIEKMMGKLHLHSWFNTVTDPCNYAFKVYNPRFSVEIDEPSAKMAYDKTIYWTSHANTSWVCYDLDNATQKEIEFDENFKIPMYYIIKFLAERRNHKKPGELYYMNFNPTVRDELDVFKLVKLEEKNQTSQ